jgi:hypothetical protein
MGTLPPGTYQNVIVPVGQTCTINNSKITGNITALEKSRLMANNNDVAGNIQADKAIRVFISGGSVGGGISIVEGPGDEILGFPFDYDIRLVRLARDIYLSKNRGFIFVTENVLPTGNITAVENVTDVGTNPQAQLNINANDIGGNLHVIKNTGRILIEGNTLPRDLLSPTAGTGNIKIEDNFIRAGQNMRIAFNGRTANVPAGIPQNLQVFNNFGEGAKTVLNNTASESIQCKENTPPFAAAGNVAPRREGQCPI